MEDHFIFDLKDLIDALFEEAKEFKLLGKSYKWLSGKNNIPDWEISMATRKVLYSKLMSRK